MKIVVFSTKILNHYNVTLEPSQSISLLMTKLHYKERDINNVVQIIVLISDCF